MSFNGELGRPYTPKLAPDLKGWWVSEKLDGVRAWWDGENFWSRQGNVYHAPDWFKGRMPAIRLDGELWVGRGKFQQTISAVRKIVPIDSEWAQVQYMAFDMPLLPGTFDSRLTELRWLHDRTHKPAWLPVSMHRGSTSYDLNNELKSAVADGAEGLMLHRGAAPHRPGRTYDVLKVKPVRLGHATVYGYTPGRGKHAGRLGALLVKLPSGEKFKLGLGFSDSERERAETLWPVGSEVRFRYDDSTDRGVPKFARVFET